MIIVIPKIKTSGGKKIFKKFKWNKVLTQVKIYLLSLNNMQGSYLSSNNEYWIAPVLMQF